MRNNSILQVRKELIYATLRKYVRGGTYATSEVNTGNTWIDGKPIYRKVIEFGALPNAAGRSVNTGLSNVNEIVNVYALGKASNGTYLVIPYISTGATTYNIQMNVTANDITITTGVDRSTVTAKVILEYTKTTD